MSKFNSITIGTFVIALLLMPLIAGCASRSPEQTVAGFFKAIEDKNFNKAKSFISNRMKDDVGDTESAYEEMANPPDADGFENPYTVENLMSEMDGENAIVWHKDFSAMKYVLVKEGGQWKIDDVDFDFSEMMEGLEDMMPEDFEMPEMPEGMEIPGG